MIWSKYEKVRWRIDDTGGTGDWDLRRMLVVAMRGMGIWGMESLALDFTYLSAESGLTEVLCKGRRSLWEKDSEANSQVACQRPNAKHNANGAVMMSMRSPNSDWQDFFSMLPQAAADTGD